MTWHDIDVGANYSFTIKITEELVSRFATLTGDDNPLHMDEEFAGKTPFKGRIAHGMLTGSMISTLIGKYLPGPGSLWLSQNYEFISPVRIGDEIQLRGEITRKSESQKVVFIRVEGKNSLGKVVLQGDGRVKILEGEKHMSNKAIKDSKVLITGASRGLGAAIALKFAENGAQVFLNYKNSKEHALKVAEQAKGSKGVFKLVQGDATTKQGIETIMKQIGDEIVDIMVFNAVNPFKKTLILEQTLDDFEQTLDYGVRSPILLLQHVLPRMIEQKYGRIISVLSTSIRGAPPPGYASYNVSKASLEAITKSIAAEYGKHNVCANMVSPGLLRTDLNKDVSERALQVVEAQTSLKRLPSLEEIAENVVYLGSPAASYLNGHNLIISGGATMI